MRILQFIDALDYGDAVSTHIIEFSKSLNRLGISNSIYSLYSDARVQPFRVDINEFKANPDDVLLYHFSGKSQIDKTVMRSPGKKLLIYHNITPHQFFEGMPRHFKHCYEGRKQLETFKGRFDAYVGVSDYNVDELKRLGCTPCFEMPIFIKLDGAVRRKHKMPRSHGRKFIFVGRVAPNKRHEDILRIFDYYYTYIDPTSALYFIGNHVDYEPYFSKLSTLLASMRCTPNVTFTGKVSEEELDYHYQTADAFLCMSEHEGFCVPLIESMARGIPTFSYVSGAIKGTMGGAGVLLYQKEYADIAELINFVLSDQKMVQDIIHVQYQRVEDFSEERREQQINQFLRNVVEL